MTTYKTAPRLAVAAIAAALAGCSTYVKRDDYDAEIAGIRDADARMARDIETMRTELASFKRDFEARLKSQEGAIAELRGRVRVDTTALFGFDDATLQEEDKAILQEFAAVVREHHPNIMVTVEGFADPAGSAAYNKSLGQRRADAVRGHLVSAGLPADKIRAVSYGEDSNRQVQPGAWGKDGALNRRTTLVVDYVASGGAQAAGT